MERLKDTAYVIMTRRGDNSIPKFCKIIDDKIYLTQLEAQYAKDKAAEKNGLDCFGVFEILVEVVKEI